VDDLGDIVPDTVQINLQHDDSVVVIQNPQCAGIFAGGTTSAVQRDVTDSGSWFTCSLVGGATGASGAVATFELLRVGPGNPTVTLHTGGATGSAFFASGVPTTAVPSNSVQILSGTRISGQVVIQGVTSEAAFALIGPDVTLEAVSGGDGSGPVTIPVEPDGSFEFNGVAEGVYDLTLDAPGTLGRKLSGFAVGDDDIVLQPVELRGGAANGDDMVTGADVSAVVGRFGMGPDELDGRQAADTGDIVDFDGDGFVTGFDISIVVSNVGETRLQEWTDPEAVPPSP
jgi:hypothetical protein